MRIIAVIQARISSSRLPAKVMLDLGGKTALERCVGRARRIDGVNDVVVATSTHASDDVIVRACTALGVRTTRGPLEDVLARYVLAARETQADALVRITSDCPLLDARESSRVVDELLAAPNDYASNVHPRLFPRGLDTEAFTTAALMRADRDASGPEREHVTMHFYKNPERFVCASVTPLDGIDRADERWTLDTIEDYCMLSAVFSALGSDAETASFQEIEALLREQPSLRRINAHITQKHA